MLFLYTAVNGDTLESIAKRFGCDVEKLKELNTIGGMGLIGQRLLIQSDMSMPEWMSQCTLCFEDLDCRQLSLLMYRCTNIVDNKKVIPDEEEPCFRMEKDEVINLNNTSEEDLPDHILSVKNENVSQMVEESKDELQCIGATNLRTYTVSKGETLTDIAIKHGVTVGMLQRCGASPNVTEGDVIHIPMVQGRRFFYTVRIGDSVEKIAERFGCSKEKIISTNLLQDCERLSPGTQLLIIV